MGSFLDKIKSLFITEVETTDSEIKENNVAGMKMDKNKKEEEKRRDDKTAAESAEPIAGKPSNDFLAILINAMQEASKEEGTYLEFKQNIKSLRHLDFDDKTRYETAFAIASNQGVDKEKLMQSASFFLEVLDKEGAKFNQTLDLQRSRRIDGQKQSIKELRDQIFEKQNEIEKIRDEIRKLEDQISTEKNILMENRSRIEKTAADFFSSIEFLKNKISKDIENFNKYL